VLSLDLAEWCYTIQYSLELPLRDAMPGQG